MPRVKNVLLKFAGFFVEKVPPAEGSQPTGHPAGSPTPQAAQHATPARPVAQPGGVPQAAYPAGTPPPAAPGPQAPASHTPPAGAVAYPAQHTGPTVAVALRAWVPQEYATYLAPFGLQVIAASGDLTVEQARAYGGQALIVSAECLGGQMSLLTDPQLPTVFVTPQSMLIPEHPGVVQVMEPLRASEVAHAVRSATQGWQQASAHHP